MFYVGICLLLLRERVGESGDGQPDSDVWMYDESMPFYVIVMDSTRNEMVMPTNGIVDAYTAVSRCG